MADSASKRSASASPCGRRECGVRRLDRGGGRQRRGAARHRPGAGAARLPQGSRPDMIEAWIEGVDAAMAAHFTPERIAAMKIRERIRALIWFRLETHRRRRAKRCAARWRSSPCRRTCRSALRTGWRSADLMWRLAGDTATDYNHYTKRLTLSARLCLDPARLARRPERGLDATPPPSSTAASTT